MLLQRPLSTIFTNSLDRLRVTRLTKSDTVSLAVTGLTSSLRTADSACGCTCRTEIHLFWHDGHTVVQQVAPTQYQLQNDLHSANTAVKKILWPPSSRVGLLYRMWLPQCQPGYMRLSHCVYSTLLKFVQQIGEVTASRLLPLRLPIGILSRLYSTSDSKSEPGSLLEAAEHQLCPSQH